MKKAFTLLELLICISIIALLAAIIFPIFKSIKLSAYKTQSISNIKQLGIAWKSYSEDFDDALMSNISNWKYWFGDDKGSILDSYVKLKTIKDPSTSFIQHKAPNYYPGYSYNYYLSPYDDDGNPIIIYYYQINNPSNTVVFATSFGLFNVNKKDDYYAPMILYSPSMYFPTYFAPYNGSGTIIWADLHSTSRIPNYYNVRFKKYNLGTIDSDGLSNTDELFDLE